VTCLREGTVALPDGRRIGFGEYGVRGGKPVLLFHGCPGGRQFDQGQPVADARAWLFVLERPGFGLSDSKPGRRVLDWPADVAIFADTFGLERFRSLDSPAGRPTPWPADRRCLIVCRLSVWCAGSCRSPRTPHWITWYPPTSVIGSPVIAATRKKSASSWTRRSTRRQNNGRPTRTGSFIPYSGPLLRPWLRIGCP
jgi:hypothetical protein